MESIKDYIKKHVKITYGFENRDTLVYSMELMQSPLFLEQPQTIIELATDMYYGGDIQYTEDYDSSINYNL